MPNPLIALTSLLDNATKAVPAVRYALGVGGIISVVAIFALYFKFDLKVAFIGAIVMFILMAILVIFAAMATAATAILAMPMIVFTWFCLIIFMATATMLFSCVFFGKPQDLTNYLTGLQHHGESGPIKTETSAADFELQGDENAVQAIQEELKLDASGQSPIRTYNKQRDLQWTYADNQWKKALEASGDRSRISRLILKLDKTKRKTCTDDHNGIPIYCEANNFDYDSLILNSTPRQVRMK